MSISRKNLLHAGLAIAGAQLGMSLLASGCGEAEEAELATDGGSTLQPLEDGGVSKCEGAKHLSISRDPKHSLSNPRRGHRGGGREAYRIEGTSSHNHDVTLEAEHFATLRQGLTVTLTSTNVFFHTHKVVIGCV